MHHDSGYFKGFDGMQLFYQSWHPAEVSKATLVIVHGFSDHCSRYKNIVNELGPRGYTIYGFDQRGHGQSPGPKGHINRFEEYREDLRLFVNLVSSKEKNTPLFLLGHSMGGLIVLDYGLYCPQGLSGVIASAPHLDNPPISPLLIKVSNLLSGIWPRFSMNAGLNIEGLSRDTNVVKSYDVDPLVHGKGSARLSTELSSAVNKTHQRAGEFTLPLLIYHGTDDILTNPQSSRRFFDNVSEANKNKTYITYEGGFHEGHNDINRERVLIDVAQWMERQIELISKESEIYE